MASFKFTLEVLDHLLQLVGNTENIVELVGRAGLEFTEKLFTGVPVMGECLVVDSRVLKMANKC